MLKSLFLSSLLLCASNVLALPVEARIPQPDNDPFYTPPAGFESKAPGTVLKNRRVIASFLGLIPDPVETHQILYRSTSINGSAIAGVTTIFKPLFAKKDRFVSFQTAYDSSATKCNPSFNYQLGSGQPFQDGIISAELLIIQAYLLSGYVVSSSDYEGPDAAFTPGLLEGMVGLDSMKAVGNYGSKIGLSTKTPKILGVGYSGGGLGTSWAASLQPTYAPELNVKGWIAGGVPANLTAVLNYIDNSAFSGFIPVAISGLAKPSAYGAQLGPVIDKYVTAEGKELLDFASTHCATDCLVKFFEKSIYSPQYQTLGTGLLSEPTVAKVLAENVLGQEQAKAPKAPVLLYHASKDEVIPYSNVQQLKGDWCSQGVPVEFVTWKAGGHVTTEALGLPDALSFAKKAFDGAGPTSCSESVRVNETLNPLALADLEPIAVALIDLLFGHKKTPTRGTIIE